MNEKNYQIKRICAHYDEFYAMTLAAAFVSSCDGSEYRRDSEKLIDFIGGAFGSDASFISLCKSFIFGDMMKIGLISDYYALSDEEYMTDDDIENLVLYEIKGRAIEEVNRSFLYGHYVDVTDSALQSAAKYESFHHTYDEKLRFVQIRNQASYGELNSIRQLGMLYALGIGCERDVEKARLHLSRAMLWCDIVSTALLASLYAYENDLNGCSDTAELFRAEKKYLNDGILDVPEEECASERTTELYTLISLMRRFVVVNDRVRNIDTAFADLILNPDIPLQKKYGYITEYRNKIWKNCIIPTVKKERAGITKREV